MIRPKGNFSCRQLPRQQRQGSVGCRPQQTQRRGSLQIRSILHSLERNVDDLKIWYKVQEQPGFVQPTRSSAAISKGKRPIMRKGSEGKVGVVEKGAGLADVFELRKEY